MNSRDLKKLKQMLIEEKEILEKELSSISIKNPSVEGDYIPDVSDNPIEDALEDAQADKVTEYTKNVGITATLESKLVKVVAALKKFENDTYGLCEKTGKEIERKRLYANPAAETCIKHLDEES